MTELPSFSDTTANLGLPLLFAGQAQKEFCINQSLAILDSAITATVLDSGPVPPAAWNDGDMFRVTSDPANGWEDQQDAIAIAVAGGWVFVRPRYGQRVFDQSADRLLIYRSEWSSADEPTPPEGGAVIDDQARAAILQIIELLRIGGFLPNNGDSL
jgi:hypothetical protein